MESVSFSPDGDYLATGSQDDTVRVHNTSDWKEVEESRLTDAESSVQSISFSPDGDYLATGSRDNVIYVYDSDWSLIQTLDDGEGSTYVMYSVSFSPDGDYLASGSTDDNVYVYDANPVSLGPFGVFFNPRNPIRHQITGKEAEAQSDGRDISDDVSISVRR